MLYAAIDIGTVTCRLFVCKLERGIQQELVRECGIVNLGIGVSKTGILQEDAIERVVSCVKEYCELVRAIAQKEDVPSIPIGAAATSALSRCVRCAASLLPACMNLAWICSSSRAKSRPIFPSVVPQLNSQANDWSLLMWVAARQK